MQKKIFIGIISVMFTGGSLFAQQTNESTTVKQEIYVPEPILNNNIINLYQYNLIQVSKLLPE